MTKKTSIPCGTGIFDEAVRYTLRDYQQQASDAAVRFFGRKTGRNGILVLPTGAGKSLVIADIASKLSDRVIVFQPSKEILEQNYLKLRSYGCCDCSIYSASAGYKDISRITFATIGSVANHIEDFRRFRYVIIDECHLVNPQGGRYMDFFEDAKRRILGLTATPYRLTTSFVGADEDGNYSADAEPENHCILKFLTRTRPRVFHDVLYQVSIQELLSRGYLATLRYFDMQVVNASGVRRNSTGMDYDDDSLRDAYRQQGLNDSLAGIVRRLMKPKSGIPRKGILVFTRYVEESEYLCRQIEGAVMVSGETPKKERERILAGFKEGSIPVVTNVGVLQVGFDYPALDTVVMARPTMSLALWYQIVGRAIRPFPGKDGWIVDLCGNIGRFGRVDDLYLTCPKPGEYMIRGNVGGSDRQLTNVYF